MTTAFHALSNWSPHNQPTTACQTASANEKQVHTRSVSHFHISHKRISQKVIPCVSPVKQMIRATSYFVPLLNSKYLYWCRQVSSPLQDMQCQCSVRWKMVTLLNEWEREEFHAVIWFLWTQNMEPINIHRLWLCMVLMWSPSIKYGNEGLTL
jgi:hypothetical protein